MVIYYAGEFLPQIIIFGFFVRGNSVSHYVDRLFLGYKITPKNQMGMNFQRGIFRITPQNRF